MTRNKSITAAVLAALNTYTLAVISATAAEPAVAVGPPVIVTATRLAENISDSNVHVTVITAAAIAEGGYTSLTEVLQARGGVEITSTGGLGQPSAVFMRGAGSGHTLLLVDGLRMSSATAGSTAFEHIPVSQIERIEIVPGPLSGVYGSDAIGGVIQIFTRGGSAGTTVKLSIGRYGTREFSGGIGRRVNDTEFSLNAGLLENSGFSATKPTIPFNQHNPDRDGYRNSNLSGRLVQHFGANHELGATAFYSNGATHFDSGPTTDDVNRQTLQAYSLFSRNKFSSDWSSLVRIGTSSDNLATVGAFSSRFRTDQRQALWQIDVKVPIGTVIGGLEYLGERVTSTSNYKLSERTVKSAFLGYRGDFGAHGVQANVRHDDNSQFGAHHTGSFGYGYRFTPEWRVRTSIGTAFKAPTFNDLYFPDFAPFYFSNPNLRPERSRNREIGLNYDREQQHVSATLFRNKISDLVVVVTDTTTFVSTTQNLSAVRIDGAELAWHGVLWGLNMRANATVQDPRDDISGKQLRRRSKRFGTFGIEKALGPWKVGVETIASGVRFDSTSEAPATRLHGYAVTNLTARYTLAKDWSMLARWGNIFDRNYETVQFYNTPRSNAMVSLMYQSR